MVYAAVRRLTLALAAAAITLAAVSPVWAQTAWPTPSGPAAATGMVPMRLNSSAQAVPGNGIESSRATYKFSSLGNAPAATPTDILTITGSATKTIRITRILVGGVATTAGQINPLLIRRSTADTGGTSTAPAIQKRDTADPAATGVVTLYTANPAALGTAVGTLDSCRLLLNLATAAPDVCQFSLGTNNDEETVLRGTTDILAINFAGAAVPAGGSIDIDVEFTEE